MSTIPEELLKIKWLKEWHHPDVLDFIRTGNPAALKKIQALNDGNVNNVLPSPSEWTEEAARVIQLAVFQGLKNLVARWLQQYTEVEDLSAALKLARDGGVPQTWIDYSLSFAQLIHYEPVTPTAAGLLLTEYSDGQIDALLQDSWHWSQFAVVLASVDPERIKALLSGGWAHRAEQVIWHWMIAVNPEAFHEMARASYKRHTCYSERALFELAKAKPELYQEWAVNELKGICREVPDDYMSRDAILCLLELEAPGAFEFAEEWMPDIRRTTARHVSNLREQVIKVYRERYPDRLRPAAEAMTRSAATNLVIFGLQTWRDAGIGDGIDRFRQALRRVLLDQNPACVVRGIKEGAASNLAGLEADLWPLMEHKSALVRSAAARALSGPGFAAAKENGVKLLHSKKADLRQTAVTLFQRIGGPEALNVLKERLDVEESDAVRDAILLALDAAGGVAVTPEERAARMAKTLAKAKGDPLSWLDSSSLHLVHRDGAMLSADEVRYLLLRQSRCAEMRADIEARPLIASLNRKACAPVALQLVEGFLASPQNAADRWVLALAALCGDDRLVPPLHKAILTWADNARGKLAEYAAGALALLGTDAALTVLESLTVRFRSKNKNIGQAAADAFAAAAEARGATVEELGDMVVPWLGFEPGVRRILQAGAIAWELWIGPDFKPVYKDQSSGKKLSKLPAAAGAALLEEQKVFAANLKEAVKAQQLRMETLLVRQFHWPVARWRELYPAHPLLRPFASQLIWRHHPADGGAVTAFRSLDDGGLTTNEGSDFSLPDNGSVSLLHPLDLTPEEKESWETHLEDYSVLPPFPQLQRPVFSCPESERAARFLKTVADTEINAMTFRGRAEKLGWVRSSVCDGGMLSAYRKLFSGTGVEAFLALDGMYVGIGPEGSITLGQACFVNAGSVKVGTYTYDEPAGEEDPRLIPLGSVPPVACSEVLADLYKISGKQQEAEPAPAA